MSPEERFARIEANLDQVAVLLQPQSPVKPRRNRSRVKGTDATLVMVEVRMTELEEALRAVQWAREARKAAVKAALAAGWSHRALAEALEVDKSWVQRVASGTWD